jgi:hypothetical protein
MVNIHLQAFIDSDPIKGYRSRITYLNSEATSEWFKTEQEAINKKDTVLAAIKVALKKAGATVTHNEHPNES